MLKKILMVFSMLMASQADAWLCPTNFSTINPGDTLDIVKAQCGDPKTEKKSIAEPNVPQEWGYYVQVNPPNPATIRMSIVIIDHKVANITVNAMSLASTSLCGGTISVGQTMDQVKASCGNPLFVTKQPPPPGLKPTEITEITYPGSAPNTLVFENNLLKERK